MTDADRVLLLEERLAHLEDQLEQLSGVVAQHAEAVEMLRQAERDRQDGTQPIGPHNDPPPHY